MNISKASDAWCLRKYLIPLAGFCAVAAATYALLAMFDPYWLRVHSRVDELQRVGRIAARLAARRTSSATLATPAGFLTPCTACCRTATAIAPSCNNGLAKAGIYHQAAVPRYFAAKLLMMMLCGADHAGDRRGRIFADGHDDLVGMRDGGRRLDPA